MPSRGRTLLLACAMLGLLATPASGADAALPDPQRVFVCAHSFMTFIAKQVPPMASAAGLGYQSAGHQMIGGSQVIQHWNLPGDKAKPALQAGQVDTLILSPTLQLPDQGIENYAKLGLAVNPRLRILVQASWPAFDDSGSKDLAEFYAHSKTFTNAQRDQATAESLDAMLAWQRAGWCTQLKSQVATLNTALATTSIAIVPVNEAVFAARKRILAGTLPGLARQTDLFSDPIGHPTPPLTVLVSYCHFAAIFQRSPVGLPVPPELKKNAKAAELNAALQEIAWQAVGAAAKP